MSDTARIRFEPTGDTTTVPVGSMLLAAIRAVGLEFDAPCGGRGTCGSCRVAVTGDLEPMSRDERELLGGAGVAAGKRLACRARVAGDVVVTLETAPPDARVVVSAGRRRLDVEPPSARGIDVIGVVVGAAIDVGTTTLALTLVDLKNGDTLAAVGDLNPQRAFGADVLSRVAHATTGGGSGLQRLVTGAIRDLLSRALEGAGLGADRLAEIVAVGNTAMTGLLLGRDVSSLGEAPYAGAPVEPARVPAYGLGLSDSFSVDLTVAPGISAFLGSDITAGLLATGLAGRSEPTLFIDLGTNGEIVLKTGDTLAAASTAAGPALEGASIECGMRAEAGAIERVRLVDGSLELGVIGEREVRGICGSGLVDLVAALLDAGVLDASGRFADGVAGPLGQRLTVREGVRVFVVDAEADVVLTQKDVRQVQLAIGAVRAGVELLLAETGTGADEIAEVIVAGGFGFHLRAASLARIGLIPAQWADRVAFEGNTALTGAEMLLVSSAARVAAAELAARVETLDLAAHPDFQERFIAALSFPGELPAV